jgi:hypothetical protein
MRWGRSARRAALSVAAAVACGATLVPSAAATPAAAPPSPAAASSAQPGRPAAQAQPGGGACAYERAELVWLAGLYLALLARHDPAPIPVTPGFRATENGAAVELGDGLWRTAGAPRFARTLVDADRCGIHTEAVIREGGADVIVGVRLLIEGDRLAEAETYVTRQGDYFVYDPAGLIASEDGGPAGVRWGDPVPEAQRATRERLVEIADLYYESFGPGGVLAPVREDCHRWENGAATATGDCGAGLEVGTPSMITHRRYPFVDVEAGVAVAYVMFGTALDFHMFKVVDGRVRRIDALVTASGHESTGWEDQEGQHGR